MKTETIWVYLTTCTLYVVFGNPQNRFLMPRYTIDRRSANGDDNCRSFTHHPNTITLRVGTLQKIGDGYNPVHCKQACIQTNEFRCAGALIQLPATCYLTGYSIKDDYFSAHFERICQHGPRCFNRRSHSSAGFTESVNIPRYFVQAWAPEVKAMYCMSYCEKREFCVGFDLREHPPSRTAHCVFMDVGTMPDATFDLYIRRC